MASRLKELEARLALLEEEVRRLRKKVEGPFADETPAERGARMWREAKAYQPTLDAAMDRLYEQMGITGEPPSMEELRAMRAEEDRKRAARRAKRKGSTA